MWILLCALNSRVFFLLCQSPETSFTLTPFKDVSSDQRVKLPFSRHALSVFSLSRQSSFVRVTSQSAQLTWALHTNTNSWRGLTRAGEEFPFLQRAFCIYTPTIVLFGFIFCYYELGDCCVCVLPCKTSASRRCWRWILLSPAFWQLLMHTAFLSGCRFSHVFCIFLSKYKG